MAFQTNSIGTHTSIIGERHSEIVEVLSLLQYTYTERNPENLAKLEERIIQRQIPHTDPSSHL
jgi:hypothetical protein